jgi:hypothetical protein
MTQRLRSNSRTRGKTFQRSSLQKHRVQKLGRSSPALATSFFSADAPRAFAMTALPTARAEVIYFGSATRRFRVQRFHARELSAH